MRPPRRAGTLDRVLTAMSILRGSAGQRARMPRYTAREYCYAAIHGRERAQERRRRRERRFSHISTTSRGPGRFGRHSFLWIFLYGAKTRLCNPDVLGRLQVRQRRHGRTLGPISMASPGAGGRGRHSCPWTPLRGAEMPQLSARGDKRAPRGRGGKQQHLHR